jgi:hypothetical protein
MIVVRHNSPAKAAPPPEQHKFVLISAAVLDRVLAALAPAADFAGDARVLGECDGAVIHPLLPLSTYRKVREMRRQLMQELAAND